MSQTTTLPAVLVTARQRALVVGGGLVALSTLGYFISYGDFFRGYLIGFLFVLGLTLGSMGLLFIHHLVGGAWGFVIQRQLEAATRVLPYVGVAAIPIVLHVLWSEHPIYHWAHYQHEIHEHLVEHDAILDHKAPYLNTSAFAVRAVVYFAIWSVLVALLNRYSDLMTETKDGAYANTLGRMAGPGIVLYMLSMTFAAFDWAMSLDPHWFSTIYGVIFIVGQVLSTMALMITLFPFTLRIGELEDAVTVDRLHDLAKLLFAFTCLWAYVQLSQFLIIWYGNLPEEAIFYHLRSHGGWEYVGLMLVLCQFVFPFLLLISRRPKRSLKWAPRIALFILAVRWLDLFYYLVPHADEHHHAHLTLNPLFVSLPVGLAALWLYLFLGQLEKRSILPDEDPRWKEKLHHGHH